MHARHNRIDRVGAQTRQYKPAVRTELYQWVVTCIGRAPAPGNKSGAEQFATAGQIHRRLRQHRQLLATENHPNVQAARTVAATLADKRHCLAVVLVDLAIHGTAVRQYQALATHRREAARQQLHVGRAQVANLDQPQWRTHHPALPDGGPAQLQTTKGRVRHGGIAIGGACDGQGACRIVIEACVIAGSIIQIARQYPGADLSRRIQLRRAQGHVTTGH